MNYLKCICSKKMRELTRDSRDVRGSGSLTMIDKTM